MLWCMAEADSHGSSMGASGMGHGELIGCGRLVR